jgi:glycosyltransferase involved in cell wall biosynthesis
MRKPHICFISESKTTYSLLTGEECSKVGGAEVQQTLLASTLRGIGYPVSFLVPDFGQPGKVVTEQGITLIKIRPQKTIRGTKFLDDIARFFQAMGRADADVYYQRAGSPVTGIAAMYCKLNRKPFVFSLASNMDLDGTWKKGLRPHQYWLFNYGLHNATAIVAQTDDQVRLLNENLGRDGVLIRSTFSSPDAPASDPKKDYILWVGNFWLVKRPMMYLELASRLPQYRFVMVGGPHGGGLEYVYEETKAEAPKVTNLEFVGPVPFSQVGRYFDGAALFVNTSSDEGFPNTYLQAWCRGVPVIGTFDADSLISRYDLGRHCDNMETLTASVDEFMKDDALRTSASERVKRYVRENHSPERVVAKYDELLMRLVER